MKKSIKILIPLLLSGLLAVAAVGCGQEANTDWYIDQSDPAAGFNTSLWYGNVNIAKGADPSMIYVSEEENAEDGGYYYAYVTSGSTIDGLRSKNLTDWQDIGGVFRPNLDVSWAYQNYWAPSVRYDGELGLYIMYYSAVDRSVSGYSAYKMSVATSESPLGPFKEYTNEEKGENEPLIDFSNMDPSDPLYEHWSSTQPYQQGWFAAIDIESFVDPATGKKYVLFVHDRTGYVASTVYIMEMEDWFTPRYDTVTRLTENGYLTVGGTETVEEGFVNEAPFMYYHDGTYYLTYSVYYYETAQYQVRQAVSDSPTGPFRKIDENDGGVIISTDGLNMYTNAAGHASIFEVGGEPYLCYHTFLNDRDIGESRKLRVEKLSYVTNSEGLSLLYANGPTVTPQPLPEAISGYRNIAPEAYVTSDNGAEGSDLYWLTDGTIKVRASSPVEEYHIKEGKSQITFTFRDWRTVRAVMVYNSYLRDESFDGVTVTLHYRDKNGEEGVISTKELVFNYEAYSSVDYDLMYVGASVAAEFGDLQVKSITLTFETDGASIPEVVVLGKEVQA